jgi:5-methyltetrahydrofolate--homocysteine methyltransferase
MDHLLEEPYNEYGYQWADPYYYSRLRIYAAQMRAVPTHAENLLWQALRSKKLDGFKFRRQHIVARYIADFICLRRNLIVEVDGLVHQLPENQQSDAEREEALNALGFTVIRFANKEVETGLEKVLDLIRTKLHGLPDIGNYQTATGRKEQST